MKKMLDELKKLNEDIQVPADFSKKVMQRIKAESINGANKIKYSNKHYKYVISCLSAAAVVLIAVTVTLRGQKTGINDMDNANIAMLSNSYNDKSAMDSNEANFDATSGVTTEDGLTANEYRHTEENVTSNTAENNLNTTQLENEYYSSNELDFVTSAMELDKSALQGDNEKAPTNDGIESDSIEITSNGISKNEGLLIKIQNILEENNIEVIEATDNTLTIKLSKIATEKLLEEYIEELEITGLNENSNVNTKIAIKE